MRIFMILAAALLIAAPAQATENQPAAAPAVTPTKAAAPWAVRCSGQEGAPERHCEIFQRLSVEKTKQRISEFAVGFPVTEGKKAKDARGVIILPLGILLTEDPQLQVDDGKKLKFSIRHCTTDGCFGIVTLNKGLLEVLQKGNEMTITGKAHTGQPVAIKMSLKGFSEALTKI